MIDRDMHSDTSRAVCPWCGHTHQGSEDWDEGRHDCAACGKPFEMTRAVEVFFTTAAILSCGVCGQQVPLDQRGRFILHGRESLWSGGERCPGSRTTPKEAIGPDVPG